MLTCSVFKIRNSQANTVVLALTWNSPIIQVSPSSGRSITEPLTTLLRLVYISMVILCSSDTMVATYLTISIRMSLFECSASFLDFVFFTREIKTSTRNTAFTWTRCHQHTRWLACLLMVTWMAYQHDSYQWCSKGPYHRTTISG